MKNLKLYLAGLFLAGFAFYSCDNADDNNENFNDAELLKTSAVIDRINEEDFQMGMETASDGSTLDSRVRPDANQRCRVCYRYPDIGGQ